MMYFFVSGETATPIRSVGRLIPGSPYSSGNLAGGVFFGPIGPTDPLPSPFREYFSSRDGSFWKGRLLVSLSRSRLLRRLLLIHAATAIAAMANTAAPTLATTMPASCGELNLVPATGTADESSAEAGAVGATASPSEVEAISLVVRDAVLDVDVLESAVVLVLESEVVLGVLELRLVVAEVVGVSTIIVARSTVCVFGSALAFPPHML